MTATDSWHRALADLVSRSHRLPPDELAVAVGAVLRPQGATATVYLVDAERCDLRPLPEPGRPTPDALPIDTSPAGRAFTHVEPRIGHGPPPRLWMPIVNGTDRLGLLEVFPAAGTDPSEPSFQDGSPADRRPDRAPGDEQDRVRRHPEPGPAQPADGGLRRAALANCSRR